MALEVKPVWIFDPEGEMFIEELSIEREVDYICDSAASGTTRVVGHNSLILFSTRTEDAWMLDPEDGLALCLMRDAQRQTITVLIFSSPIKEMSVGIRSNLPSDSEQP